MKTIVQKVIFKNTTPEKIYELYMDAKLHSLITAHPAKISKKEGASFRVYSSIFGKNLKLIPGKLIVQTWKMEDWKKSDLDSIFMLQLEKSGGNAVLNMVHANIPDDQAEGIKSGWKDFYWDLWKKHLADNKNTNKESK